MVESEQKPPPCRAKLIRTCLLEIGIGFVAVVVIILVKGGWSRFEEEPFTSDFFIEVITLGLLILLAALLLAIRDYRNGVKKIREWEERAVWGRSQ